MSSKNFFQKIEKAIDDVIFLVTVLVSNFAGLGLEAKIEIETGLGLGKISWSRSRSWTSRSRHSPGYCFWKFLESLLCVCYVLTSGRWFQEKAIGYLLLNMHLTYFVLLQSAEFRVQKILKYNALYEKFCCGSAAGCKAVMCAAQFSTCRRAERFNLAQPSPWVERKQICFLSTQGLGWAKLNRFALLQVLNCAAHITALNYVKFATLSHPTPWICYLSPPPNPLPLQPNPSPPSTPLCNYNATRLP